MQRALAAFCARAAEPATAAPAPAEAAAAATAPPAPLLPAEPHPVSISGETRPNASASSDRAPVQPSLADTRLAATKATARARRLWRRAQQMPSFEGELHP